MVAVDGDGGWRNASGVMRRLQRREPCRSRPPPWPNDVLVTPDVMPGMLWRIADESEERVDAVVGQSVISADHAACRPPSGSHATPSDGAKLFKSSS